MSAINFPDAPSPGQIFTNWKWDGTKWVPAVGITGGAPFIGSAPPPNPLPGALWWDDVGGQLYIFYNDGNSSQWVLANVSPQGVAGPTGPQGPVGTTLPMGVTDGSNAVAGQVGEYIKIAGMVTSGNGPVSTNLPLTPNLVLPPGDWEITGAMSFDFTSPTVGTVSPAISLYIGSLFYNGTELTDARMQSQLDPFPSTPPTQPISSVTRALPTTRVNSNVQATMGYVMFWQGVAASVQSAVGRGWMAGRRMR